MALEGIELETLVSEPDAPTAPLLKKNFALKELQIVVL